MDDHGLHRMGENADRGVGNAGLLNTARHHCQAIQTIIDQLTETKSDTELRLLSQRLQRLAFHAAPPSRAVEKVRTR
jgi:hypothetical protein